MNGMAVRELRSPTVRAQISFVSAFIATQVQTSVEGIALTSVESRQPSPELTWEAFVPTPVLPRSCNHYWPELKRYARWIVPSGSLGLPLDLTLNG